MNPTIAAIIGYTNDPRQQLAMAYGSAMEGGWTPPFPVGDYGHSHGPYQINLPYHPGVTAAQAEDPYFATAYMAKAYAGGVRAAGPLWSTDPMLAANKAAYTAERPAQDYMVARGRPAVSSAFARAMNAIPQSSAEAIVKDGGEDWSKLKAGGEVDVDNGRPWYDIPGRIKDGVTGVAEDAIGGVFGAIWGEAKPFVVTMAFAGLGLALIGGGLFISTRGARESITSTLPAAPAPSGGGGAAAPAAGAALPKIPPVAV